MANGRKHTVSQAKNRMRKAVDVILDPWPPSIDPLWDHFESHCAYCDRRLDRTRREGHVDHADPRGGNHLGNLVLACASCNGDEKREERWDEFLRRTTSDDALFQQREARIRSWFAAHPRAPIEHTPEIAEVRAQIEDLIEEFAGKCSELRQLVKERNASQA